MFGTLEAAVDELDIPLHREALSEAFAIRDRLDARLAAAVGAYEAAGLHELDGDVTMAGWLRHHVGLDSTAATRTTVRARKLAALPVLGQAFSDGLLSGGQVDVVLAHLPARHIELFATHEASVVATLAALTVEETARAMTEWKARADALDDDSPPVEHENQLHLSKTIGGRGELHGSFDADLHALVATALRVADPGDFDLTPAERRATALGQVCQHFLDHQRARTGGRHRPHLNVGIVYEGLVGGGVGGSYLDTGLSVSSTQLGVLSCDSALHRLLYSATSGILDYGRATRTWPVDIYNAVLARDQGCRWPGCTAPSSWCDVHHVLPWEDGGSTSVDNGFMACRRHHRVGHQPGWHTKLLPSGDVEITHPDGRTELTHPRGPIPQPLWRQPAGG